MATIKDVAKLAGVSPTLVSRVLNDKPGVSNQSRAEIERAIIALNYCPNPNARALSKGEQSAVAVILPNLITPYFSSIASGIENITSKHNVSVVLHSSSFDLNNEKVALDMLIEQRYQSIILFSTSIGDNQLIEYVDKVPGLVLFDRKIPEIASRCVWLDDQAAAEQMALALYHHQHKRIAVITLPNSLLHSSLRFYYFKQVLQSKGIEICLIEACDGTIQGGKDATYNLLASGQQFTALACFNDATAYGACTVLTEQGVSIPRDVSIIGFNDSIYSRMFVPNFHTIHTPVKQMAEYATELSIALTKGISPIENSSDNCFEPHLVHNESVCEPQR